jgi:two-component system sensor histidine kinase DegS
VSSSVKIPGVGRKTDFFVPRLLINAMKTRKAEILRSVFQVIRNSDEFDKSYREFLAESQEGRRRIGIVYELLLKGLHGNLEPVVEDQSRTGYIRATQDVPLEDTLQVHRIFERAIIDEFLYLYSDSDMSYKDLQEETRILAHVSDVAREAVSKSYIRTKEEIIEKRTQQIEGLYRLRIALDERLSIGDMGRLLIANISSVLGATHAVLTIHDPRTRRKRFTRIGSSDASVKMFQDDAMDEILVGMHGIRVPHLVDQSNRRQYPVSPEELNMVPFGYWLVIPIFTGQNFYGFLSIGTRQLYNRFIGAEAYVILSVVSKIAEAMEREQTFRELYKSRSELRRLANRIIHAQEEERKKISAEIHDTLLQRLTGILYKLVYLEETSCLAEQHSGEVRFLKTCVTDSIREARRIIYGLRPLMLDQLGLSGTIQEYAKTFEESTSISVGLRIEGNPSALPAEKQTSIFRILQEALENVKKHSNSPRVDVSIRSDAKGCSFAVEDFGTREAVEKPSGPEFPRSHFGLMIMDERAKAMGGSVRYRTRRGGGFVVRGHVPCK